MGVSQTNAKDILNGNGATLLFNYTFRALTTGDIQVFLVDDVTRVETLQVLTTDYTITLDSDGEGGTVTFVVAPPSTTDVLIKRNMTLDQPTSIVVENNLREDKFETAYDRNVLYIQQMQEQLGRAILFKIGSLEADVELPEMIANTVIGFNDVPDAIKLFTPTELFTIASGHLAITNNLNDVANARSSVLNLGIDPFGKAKNAVINDSQGAPLAITGFTLDAVLFTSGLFWSEVKRGSAISHRYTLLRRVSGVWVLDNSLPKYGPSDGLTLTVTEAGGIAQVNYISGAQGVGTIKFKGLTFDV